MSRLDLWGAPVHAALISAPRAKNPGTRTDASADGTGVLRCLWADRFGLDHCPAIEDRYCCLVDEWLWDDTPYGEQGRLF